MEIIENMQGNEILEKVDLPEGLKKEAREIRKQANRILHRAKIQNTSEVQENALSAIRSTTSIVEKLFS